MITADNQAPLCSFEFFIVLFSSCPKLLPVSSQHLRLLRGSTFIINRRTYDQQYGFAQADTA